MAVYRIREDSLYLHEIPMYGSNRLGVIKEKMYLAKKHTTQNTMTALPVSLPLPQLSPFTATQTVYSYGKKHYETTDWLGNVRVTYTDKKSWQQNKFALNVSSSQDYYPFGMLTPGRVFNSGAYRFGWNTQEKTDEIAGSGNHYTATYWEYNSRVVHRWNMDPKIQASWSPYAINWSNPIWYHDPLGDQGKNPIKDLIRGIGNVLSGRPWKAQYKTNLGSKIKREKEWAYIRKNGGLVTESYMNQLRKKAEKSVDDPSRAWAGRLLERIESSLLHELDVIEPMDVNQPGTASENIHIPDVPKAFQAALIPSGPLAGGQRLDIYKNHGELFNTQGFARFKSILFKVNNSDNIQLNLSRVQPTFGNLYRPTPSISDIPVTIQYASPVIPSFTFHFKIQIRR